MMHSNVGHAALVVGSMLVWMASSSYLIFLNKTLLVDEGFPYPLALTGLGQLMGAGLAFIAAHAGLMPLKRWPGWHGFLQRLLPLALCSGMSLALGNFAYLSLSVAFLQILKVLTPAVIYLVCLALGAESFSPLTILSIAMICGGTAVTITVESGAAVFSWIGLASFLASIVLEAVRVIAIQRLLNGSLAFNPNEVLVFMGPSTGIALLLGALTTERHGLLRHGVQVLSARWLLFLSAGVTGYVVNTSTNLAIQSTSGLTFKVAGCVKNALVVWAGVALGDSITRDQLIGYGVSLAGFALYMYSKARMSQQLHMNDVNKKE